MNNLIKMVINTRYNSNKKLLLRLCCNADRVRNFKNTSGKTLNKIMNTRKEEFNRILNVRTYGQQLNSVNMLSVEQNNASSEPLISENQHARRLLGSSVHYTNTILQPSRFKVIVTNEEAQQILDTDWSMAELKDFVSAFKKLSYNIMNTETPIDKTKYKNIVNTLNTRIPDLTDDLFEEIMKTLIPFRERTMVDLAKTCELLDKECEKRYTRWPIDKMLLMSDIFYCLNIHKDSNFIWRLKRKMNSKLNKLTPKNLVQLLFLVNVTRKSELNMYEVEVCLEKNIDDITIGELGIIAMGFFKSKSKIRNNLFLRVIIGRLISELDKVDSCTLAALVKLIRYSMQYNEIIHFRLLLNSIVPYTHKFGLMTLTHIAHACAKAIVYEKPLIDAIIERICNEIKCARLKDIERIVFMLSTFDIDARHPIYNKLVEEITERINSDKKEEILKHPHVLPTLLLFLSHKDIYPLHLVKLVMDPSYLVKVHKGYLPDLGTSYCLLQDNIKVDRPDYTGPLLEERPYRTLTKQHWKFGEKQYASSYDRLVNEIIYVIQGNITKDVDLYIGKLLPNVIPNYIVIGIDENQNYVSAKPILSELSDFTIKRVDDTFPKNIKWIVFLIIHYIHKIKGTNQPVGMINARLRHLERIGYIPILITDDDWITASDTEEGKTSLLQNRIKHALHS